jgi:hypothetical protein
MLARDTIARSDRSAHTDEQMARYTSDSFYDNLLRSAANKGFDKGRVSLDGNQTEFMNDFVFVTTDNVYYQKSTRSYIPITSMAIMVRNQIGIPNGHVVFADAQGVMVNRAMSLPGLEPNAVVQWDSRRVYNKWRGRQATQLEKFDACAITDQTKLTYCSTTSAS